MARASNEPVRESPSCLGIPLLSGILLLSQLLPHSPLPAEIRALPVTLWGSVPAVPTPPPQHLSSPRMCCQHLLPPAHIPSPALDQATAPVSISQSGISPWSIC